ncbi:MAG: acetate--CoA ligase family protein [Actinomycetota bacterium]|nr:acetate--CoA ligase family protein [Actinomycetota bacterium]
MIDAEQMRALRAPSRVAVIGANDDPTTFGGRFWRHAGLSRGIERVAVNKRPGAIRDGKALTSLHELSWSPDLVVIATPPASVEALLNDCIEVGARAAVVLASVPAHARCRVSALCAGRIALLGGSSLGILDVNRGVVLSSSVSLDLPLHGGPAALISQSGALMGVLHARALCQGIGLGVCVATGEQLGLRVEHLLGDLVDDDRVSVLGIYLEDVDPALFSDAAQRAREAGKRVVALKGGLTARGASVAAAHSGALASDGRAFAALMRELDVVVAEDPEDLLNCLHVSSVHGRSFFVGTLSGGMATVAADLAGAAGIDLAPVPLANPTHGTLPTVTYNPVDIDALAPTDAAAARLVRALAMDEAADGLVFVANDRPGLESLLECVKGLEASVHARIIVCSECSGQYEPVLTDHLVPGLGFVRGIAPIVRALAKTRAAVAASAPARRSGTVGVLGTPATWELLERAGVPAVPLMAARSIADIDAALRAWGPDLVVKRDGVGHRAAGEVVQTHGTERAHAAFEQLSSSGEVVVQQCAEPGLEFFVGILRDPIFGKLFSIGTGGPAVEMLADVAVHVGIPDSEEVRALLARTVVGRWLDASPTARALVDIAALCEVALGLCALFATNPDIEVLDANPVVAGPWGARAVDVKVRIRGIDLTEEAA